MPVTECADSDARPILKEICHLALSWLLLVKLALVPSVSGNFFSSINLINQGHSH